MASYLFGDALLPAYFTSLQGQGNAADFAAGVGDAAAPALQFMSDMAVLSNAYDPDTHQFNPDYQTAQGQAEYAAAQERIAGQLGSVVDAGGNAAAAAAQFLADITPPCLPSVPGQCDATPEQWNAYYARSQKAGAALATGVTAAVKGTLDGAAGFVDNCVIGGNDQARACGSSATTAGAGVIAGVATDGVVNGVVKSGNAASDAADDILNATNRIFNFSTESVGNDLRRFTSVDGREIRINSGHAYNRTHAGGDVAQIGTMDEIETAILQDISMNTRLDGLQLTQTYTVQVNGHSVSYTLAMTPNGPVISNYFPPIPGE